MAKRPTESLGIIHLPKSTSIGDGKIKMSSMNKNKKRSYKKYRGQGR